MIWAAVGWIGVVGLRYGGVLEVDMVAQSMARFEEGRSGFWVHLAGQDC